MRVYVSVVVLGVVVCLAGLCSCATPPGQVFVDPEGIHFEVPNGDDIFFDVGTSSRSMQAMWEHMDGIIRCNREGTTYNHDLKACAPKPLPFQAASWTAHSAHPLAAFANNEVAITGKNFLSFHGLYFCILKDDQGSVVAEAAATSSSSTELKCSLNNVEIATATATLTLSIEERGAVASIEVPLDPSAPTGASSVEAQSKAPEFVGAPFVPIMIMATNTSTTTVSFTADLVPVTVSVTASDPCVHISTTTPSSTQNPASFDAEWSFAGSQCQAIGSITITDKAGRSISTSVPLAYGVAWPYATCHQLSQAQSGLSSGLYKLYINNQAHETYCDIDVYGGAWTLVFKYLRDHAWLCPWLNGASCESSGANFSLSNPWLPHYARDNLDLVINASMEDSAVHLPLAAIREIFVSDTNSTAADVPQLRVLFADDDWTPANDVLFKFKTEPVNLFKEHVLTNIWSPDNYTVEAKVNTKGTVSMTKFCFGVQVPNNYRGYDQGLHTGPPGTDLYSEYSCHIGNDVTQVSLKSHITSGGPYGSDAYYGEWYLSDRLQIPHNRFAIFIGPPPKKIDCAVSTPGNSVECETCTTPCGGEPDTFCYYQNPTWCYRDCTANTATGQPCAACTGRSDYCAIAGGYTHSQCNPNTGTCGG